MKKDLTEEVLQLVKEVGEFIRNERKTFKPEVVEEKTFNNLVSYVDKEAEKRLVERLSQIVPEAGFIAEEGTVTESESRWKWIVDPLDGTTNFVHNIPAYSISVGLAYDEDIHLGVIYEITRDESFYAVKGKGAFLNGERIEVSPITELKQSLIATGFPYYDFGRMESYLAILDKVMKLTHGARRIGSAAVDLAYVACGRFEGFFEYNLNPWDVAAGILLVKEAGGIVSDFSGGNNFLFGREIIAAGPVHPQLLEVIKKEWY